MIAKQTTISAAAATSLPHQIEMAGTGFEK